MRELVTCTLSYSTTWCGVQQHSCRGVAKSFLAVCSQADSSSPLSGPPSLLIPGIEATLCLKCCTWRGDISLPFIPLCLSNSILFSGSERHVHKWHQDDNYYNYVLIQRQHCGIVSVSFSLHNCGTSDGLIAANTTSWAIIHHPPHFFSLSRCWTMLVTFVGVIRLIQLMKRRGNTE